MSFISIVVKQFRVKQWVKNLFVFIPLFVAGQIGETDKLIRTIYAFLFFCAASSMIYIINDIVDLEKDKLHPEKSKRPIASGKLSVQTAWLLVVLLAIIVFPVQYLFLAATLPFIAAYVFQNFLYSYYFKKIAILDVSFIAVGFVLRVLVGVAANGLPFSHWLIIMTFCISMLLALGKRKGEIQLNIDNGNKRHSLNGYNEPLINALQIIFLTVTVVVYIMYTFFNEYYQGNKNLLFYSTFFVILGLMRYMQLSFVFNNIESPTDILLKDKFILFTVLSWGAYLGLITYFI